MKSKAHMFEIGQRVKTKDGKHGTFVSRWQGSDIAVIDCNGRKLMESMFTLEPYTDDTILEGTNYKLPF